MSESHAPQTTVPGEITPEQTQEINKHIKGYIKIGILQVIFSLVTVGVSYISFSSFGAKAVAVLLAACGNATLVAGILMHLKDEKRMIWKFLIFTGIFFFVLFGLTYLAHTDGIQGSSHTHH
jgi:heme/copper-type cytochrome/quinol oxidase subunit 4